MGSVGDCWDRYYVRMRELEESVKIVRQALDAMPRDGDVHASLPKKSDLKLVASIVDLKVLVAILGFML